MNRIARSLMILALSAFPLLGLAADNAHPHVRLITTLGTIELELNAQAAPQTTRNFLKYVRSGFYNGTIFHRVIPNFMIQGGGFLPGMTEKPHDAPIRNEAGNGLKNLAGTIAMARTSDPDSAAAQFFINTADNDFLNHTDDTPGGFGYAVFGKVVRGMDVVKKIAGVPTHTVGEFENVPVRDVVIKKAEIVK
jgi:cyclophilin family peptidyl-prolyl cis-trans isomerase